MKYKYPKKIVLGCTEFDIKYDKKSLGGSFHYPSDKKRGLITIGIENNKTDPLDFLNVVTHEISEILHIELY